MGKDWVCCTHFGWDFILFQVVKSFYWNWVIVVLFVVRLYYSNFGGKINNLLFIFDFFFRYFKLVTNYDMYQIIF